MDSDAIGPYGNFGNLAESYNAARHGYPPQAIRFFLTKLLPGENGCIIDIGCGTGIATRQLALSGREVIGCDRDSEMLTVAARHSALDAEVLGDFN